MISENVKNKKSKSSAKRPSHSKGKKPRPMDLESKAVESPRETAYEPSPSNKHPAPAPQAKAPITEPEDSQTVTLEEVPAGFLTRRPVVYPSTSISPDEVAHELKVKLSGALWRKLNQQANDEGLAIDELARELLAESVVLRAWEIIERKNQMRGGNPNHNSGNNNNNRNPSQGGHRNNHRKGGGGHRMNPMRYQSIMDDKANFLEYVRNQEQRNRR